MEHHVYNPEAGTSVHTNRKIEGSVTKPKAPVFWCEACELVLSSPTVALQHLRGRPHASKISKALKREQNSNEPDNNEPAVKKVKVKEDPVKCEECKLEFTSSKTALEHFKGRRHAATLAKLKGDFPVPMMRSKGGIQSGKGKGFRNQTGYPQFKQNSRANFPKPYITTYPLHIPPHNDQAQKNVQKMQNYHQQYKSNWVKPNDNSVNKSYGYSSYKGEKFSSPLNSPLKSRHGSNFSDSVSKQPDNTQYTSVKSNTCNYSSKQGYPKVSASTSVASCTSSKSDLDLQNSGYSTYSNFGPKSYSFIASQVATNSTSNGYYSETPKSIPTVDTLKDHRVIAPPKKDSQSRNSSSNNYRYNHGSTVNSNSDYNNTSSYSSIFSSQSDSLSSGTQKSFANSESDYSQSYSSLNLSSNYSKLSQYDTNYSSVDFSSVDYTGTSNPINGNYSTLSSNSLSNFGSSSFSSNNYSSMADYSTSTYSSMSNYSTSDYGSSTNYSSSIFGISSSYTDSFKSQDATVYSNSSNYVSSSSYNVNSSHSLDDTLGYSSFSNSSSYASPFISYSSYSSYSR